MLYVCKMVWILVCSAVYLHVLFPSIMNSNQGKYKFHHDLKKTCMFIFCSVVIL